MKRFFLILLCAFITSCAQLIPTKPPEVALIGLKRLEPNGFEQRFLISLRLTNPNKQSLPVQSLSYRLNINGQPLVNGSSGALPTLAGHSDTQVDLEARINLISAIGQLAAILQQPDAPLQYQLEADIQLRNLPDIQVKKSGQIPLQ